MNERTVRWLKTIPGIAGVLSLALAVLGRTLPGDTSRTSQLALAGAALVLLWAAVNIAQLRALARRRSTREGTGAALLVVLFTAMLVLIQAISLENRHQFDITRSSLFSLAPQTTQVLGALDTDISIQGFFRQGSDAAADARVLFNMYRYASDRVSWDIVDPDRNPRLAEELGARPGEVVVTAGARRRVARRATEQAITSAIIQATRTRTSAVYFVGGHNEKQIDDKERGGYAVVRRALEDEGYTVRNLSLLDVDRVPDDCELLVVAGPTRAFLATEVHLVSRYLEAGGAALFLIDPRRELPGIEAQLERYRIALDPVVLLDELVVVGQGDRVFDATVTKVRRYGRHEITNGFNTITLYPMARPVRITERAANGMCEAHYLAWTGKSSWGETDMESFRRGQASLDDDDYAPPLPLAVAAECPSTGPGSKGTSRVVVFGDSDFANNTFFGLLGNRDLFLNTVAWLTGSDDLISIRPNRDAGDRVFINAAQGRLVFVLCLVFPPLAIFAVGATVLTRRRRT